MRTIDLEWASYTCSNWLQRSHFRTIRISEISTGSLMSVFDKLSVWRQWQNNWRDLQLQATVGCCYWATVTKDIPSLSTYNETDKVWFRNGIYSKSLYLSYNCIIYLVYTQFVEYCCLITAAKSCECKKVEICKSIQGDI